MIKIQNKDGISSILVQKNDIEKLREFNIIAPESIISKYENELNSGNNQADFIEYTDFEEIEFFLNQNWILDYDVFKQFSSTELEIARKSILVEIATLKKELKKFSFVEKKRLIMLEIEKKNYILDTILYLKKFKRAKNQTETDLFNISKTR